MKCILVRLDWSTSQVEKHELEIRSLLGNFYLRMQNEAINARLPESNLDAPLDRNILLDARNDGKEGTAVRENLLGLKSRVQDSLERHDVGRALDEIVNCLNIVRVYSHLATSGVTQRNASRRQTKTTVPANPGSRTPQHPQSSGYKPSRAKPSASPPSSYNPSSPPNLHSSSTPSASLPPSAHGLTPN